MPITRNQRQYQDMKAIIASLTALALSCCSPSVSGPQQTGPSQITEVAATGDGFYSCYILRINETGERFLVVRAAPGGIYALPIKPTTTESK